MRKRLHTECLPAGTQRIAGRLSSLLKEYEFVLAGGTAAALHMGHRISEDLDFFTARELNTERLLYGLKRTGLTTEILSRERGTLIAAIEGVKVSFFHYPYPFIEKMVTFKSIRVANLVDIASMKLVAIVQRGCKRDFVDLFFIFKEIPFFRIAENMVERFGKEMVNPALIGKSLVFFQDAEYEPEPRYTRGNKTPWKEIKDFFRTHIKEIVWSLQSVMQGSVD